MQIKMIEIRDHATCIPAMAILMSAEDEIQMRFFGRVGFSGNSGIILMRLNDQEAHSDPYDWPQNPRTMRAAHAYLIGHWDELSSGDVVDARVQLGEERIGVLPEIYDRMNP
tara:strand:+ start:2147 stop:2482 length:336 start_codon:yes stop_codon:yes gene_type:complete